MNRNQVPFKTYFMLGFERTFRALKLGVAATFVLSVPPETTFVDVSLSADADESEILIIIVTNENTTAWNRRGFLIMRVKPFGRQQIETMRLGLKEQRWKLGVVLTINQFIVINTN